MKTEVPSYKEHFNYYLLCHPSFAYKIFKSTLENLDVFLCYTLSQGIAFLG